METANSAEGSHANNPAQSEESSNKKFIFFNLKDLSDIKIELYNLNGEKCGTIALKNLHPGEHQLEIQAYISGITAGRHVYYLQVSSSTESFTECRSINI